jgi:hypothetical protein
LIEATDQSANSIPALRGNGKLVGTLTITGTEFKNIYRGFVVDNTAVGDIVSYNKLKRIVFNKNTMSTLAGSVQFHGMETMPTETC